MLEPAHHPQVVVEPRRGAPVAVLPVNAVFETPEALGALIAPIFKRAVS